MSATPNASSMFKWTNNFATDIAGGSQDFLQLVRQSDGAVLGYIDPTGTPQGSLANGSGLTAGSGITISGGVISSSNASSGIRVLKGSATNSDYTTSSTSFVNVDGTNLSTSIAVPAGYTLVVTVAGTIIFNGPGTDAAAYVAIAIDGNPVNNQANLSTDVWAPFSFSASFAGDDSSHTVALQYRAQDSGGATSTAIISNQAADGGGDGAGFATMSLVLLPSI